MKRLDKMKNNEINHKAPFRLRTVHVFWIVAVMILIWASGCSHSPSLPEGYKILCNEQGQYLLVKGEWMSESRFEYKSHAIAYANKWEDLHNINRWSDCEGE